MKFVSIAALMLAAAFWAYADSYQTPLRLTVSVGACLVAVQAVREKKYAWAVGFYGLMLMFNPFVPLVTLSGSLAFGLVLASVLPFAASVTMLPTRALLSIPSITDRAPGSESL